MTEYNKAWRQRNPEKVAAHTAINWAVRTGKLKRQPCEACGKPEGHAHHDDYAKKLEVRWLCGTCHGKLQSKGWTRPISAIRRRRDRMKLHAQALRDHGTSYGQIGKSIGVSIGTVYKWLNATPYK